MVANTSAKDLISGVLLIDSTYRIRFHVVLNILTSECRDDSTVFFLSPEGSIWTVKWDIIYRMIEGNFLQIV